MDCLDRTNVVQGVFARYRAFYQLSELGLVDIPEDLLNDPFKKFPGRLEQDYRNSWSDNADVISQLYAGTPALKTDFTRTGERTFAGSMKDGKTAVTRFYINNFDDPHYVDC
jgi:phosphatidylinositol 4-phosphatase